MKQKRLKNKKCPLCGKSPLLFEFEGMYYIACDDECLEVESKELKGIEKLWDKVVAIYDIGNCPLCNHPIKFEKLYTDYVYSFASCTNPYCLLHVELNDSAEETARKWREKTKKE